MAFIVVFRIIAIFFMVLEWIEVIVIVFVVVSLFL